MLDVDRPISRDSVHVPIPKSSAIASARISAAVEEERDPALLRSAGGRDGDAELSVIEESVLSTVDSRKTRRGSVAPLSSHNSGSQTDQYLLDDLLRSLERPDPISLLRVPLHASSKRGAGRSRHAADQPKRALSMNVKHAKPRRLGRSTDNNEEDEVLDLIDSCRRYNEGKALEHHGSHSPLIRKSSSNEELLHLLDRPVILPSPVMSGDEQSSGSEDDERRNSKHLSSMLAGTIGSSFRTFVGTAMPTGNQRGHPSSGIRRPIVGQTAPRRRWKTFPCSQFSDRGYVRVDD